MNILFLFVIKSAIFLHNSSILQIFNSNVKCLYKVAYVLIKFNYCDLCLLDIFVIKY